MPKDDNSSRFLVLRHCSASEARHALEIRKTVFGFCNRRALACIAVVMRRTGFAVDDGRAKFLVIVEVCVRLVPRRSPRLPRVSDPESGRSDSVLAPRLSFDGFLPSAVLSGIRKKIEPAFSLLKKHVINMCSMSCVLCKEYGVSDVSCHWRKRRQDVLQAEGSCGKKTR